MRRIISRTEFAKFIFGHRTFCPMTLHTSSDNKSCHRTKFSACKLVTIQLTFTKFKSMKIMFWAVMIMNATATFIHYSINRNIVRGSGSGPYLGHQTICPMALLLSSDIWKCLCTKCTCPMDLANSDTISENFPKGLVTLIIRSVTIATSCYDFYEYGVRAS